VAGYITKEEAKERLSSDDFNRVFPEKEEGEIGSVSPSSDVPGDVEGELSEGLTEVDSTEVDLTDANQPRDLELTKSGDAVLDAQGNLVLTSTPNLLLKPLHPGGRKNGDANIDPAIRTLIGVAANAGTTKAAAEVFGVSHSQANNLKHGITTRANGTNAALKREVRNTKKDLQEKALAKALKAVGLIDDENLADLKAPALAAIAKDLSSISRNTSEDSQLHPRNTQIIFYAPKQKGEDGFGVIDIEAVG